MLRPTLDASPWECPTLLAGTVSAADQGCRHLARAERPVFVGRKLGRRLSCRGRDNRSNVSANNRRYALCRNRRSYHDALDMMYDTSGLTSRNTDVVWRNFPAEGGPGWPRRRN